MTAQPGSNITQVSGQDVGGSVPTTPQLDEVRGLLRAILMVLIEAYQLPNSPSEYFEDATKVDFQIDR